MIRPGVKSSRLPEWREPNPARRLPHSSSSWRVRGPRLLGLAASLLLSIAAGLLDDTHARASTLDRPAGSDLSFAQESARYLSAIRQSLGLMPVQLDLTSTEGAGRHAVYLALNMDNPSVSGLQVHSEDPSLPGATSEGQLAGGRSDISLLRGGEPTPSKMMDYQLNAPLHRHLLLQPNLNTIGVGVQRAASGTAAVYDVVSGLLPPDRGVELVPWPVPGSHQVNRTLSSEVPDPRDALGVLDKPRGYPLSLHAYGCSPTAARAVLSSDGHSVDALLLQAGVRLGTDGDSRTIPAPILFPRDPLRAGATYHVEFQVRCDGAWSSQGWTFTTGNQ